MKSEGTQEVPWVFSGGSRVGVGSTRAPLFETATHQEDFFC